MAKRPPLNLDMITAADAAPMRDASQRTAEPPSVVPAPPPVAALKRAKAPEVPADELVPLYFKVPPAFNKRYRRLAFDADLKLNELLFEAVEAWEKAKGKAR
jgi:hypothetical protein